MNERTRDGMRVGVVLPARGPFASGPALADVAEAAEGAGFASVWATDHVIFPADIGRTYPNSDTGVPRWDHQSSWIEALSALAWAGARTTTIRLGTAVLVLPIRSVVYTAKQVASLDHLSGGRVVLGVGAGWLREEFEYLGASFDDRGKRLSEGMRLLRACWSADPISFAGDFHQVDGALMQPKPHQGAAVPLLVGGHSRAALNRAARLGDGWLASQLSPEEIAEGRVQLAGLADEAGREPGELAVYARAKTGAEVTADLLDGYRQAGVDELLVDVHTTADDLDACIRRLAAVGELIR
jgi:probable F420-dependent oxidoreductase